MNKTFAYTHFLVRIFTFIAWLVTPTTSHAQDTTARKLEINGYISSLQSAAFDNPANAWHTSQLIHNRININANLWQEKLKCFASLRNRLSWADKIDNQQLFTAIQSGQSGWIDASFDLAKGQSYRLNTEIDRLYLSYEHKNVIVSAGRQRINWSQTFVWNPNDLFNAYSFYDLDYIERPGSDAVRIQYFPTEVSTAEAALKIDHNQKVTAGIMYRFNTHGYDIQLLSGLLEESDYIAGLGWSGSLLGRVSVRGEITWLHPTTHADSAESSLLVALSADYTFPSSLTLQGEYYFNQLAPHSFDQLTFLNYLNSTGNIKTLSPSRHNLMTQIGYPFTPLINGSIAIVFMPSLNGYYYAPSITCSLAQNLDASLFWQAFNIHFENKSLTYNLLMIRLKFYW